MFLSKAFYDDEHIWPILKTYITRGGMLRGFKGDGTGLDAIPSFFFHSIGGGWKTGCGTLNGIRYGSGKMSAIWHRRMCWGKLNFKIFRLKLLVRETRAEWFSFYMQNYLESAFAIYQVWLSWYLCMFNRPVNWEMDKLCKMNLFWWFFSMFVFIHIFCSQVTLLLVTIRSVFSFS